MSIAKHLTRWLGLCLVLTATGASAVPRNYSATNGTVDLAKVYHVTKDKDATLRTLGYSEAMAKDSFPAFNMWWTAHGWPSAELLDLYLFECSFNDAVFSSDTYLGIGIYVRSNYVTQSRIWVQCPDGWFRVRFGCMTGLGRYSGKHAQVYSSRDGTNPGCTPGTCIEIDHAGWSSRSPDRVCLNSTAWGKDYGVIGGLAYTEGIIIESFRLVGNNANYTGAAFCTGVTMNEPGENSVIRYCMATNFTGPGYTVFNGTPFEIHTCSSFNNYGPGFDLLGSNGLCNVTLTIPSGDNNATGLVRIRPKDAQSVGGGTITIRGMKSESRNVLQIPIVIEGKMGDLNLTVDGLTANFDGVTAPYLIGGNWSGTQFEIAVRGLDLRSNTTALAYQGSTGLTVKGGKAYSGNSFTWNDEGLPYKSRANMTLTTGTPTGSWSCTSWSTCTGGTQTRTCTCSGTCADPKPAESQGCTVPPSGNAINTTGWIVTASSTNAGGRELPAYALDGNLTTVWTNGVRQDVGDAWIQFDAGSEQTFKSATFRLPSNWANDYARTPQVYVGASSSSGVLTAATFAGTSTMTVTFPTPAKGRYFRLIAKKTTGIANWFTVGGATFTKP